MSWNVRVPWGPARSGWYLLANSRKASWMLRNSLRVKRRESGSNPFLPCETLGPHYSRVKQPRSKPSPVAIRDSLVSSALWCGRSRVMAQRVLDKGGFGFFFSNRFPGLDDYNEFIEPYRRIGSLEAAASIQKALEFFTPWKAPRRTSPRRRYSDGQPAPRTHKPGVHNESLCSFDRRSEEFPLKSDRNESQNRYVSWGLLPVSMVLFFLINLD
jgi:hypothetical protein